MSNVAYNLTKNLAGLYGWANGLWIASSIPATVGSLTVGAIGSVPASLAALAHTALVRMENKGIIAPGRAKMLTPLVSSALAAITYTGLIALGITSPLGALLIVLPTLTVGILLAYLSPDATKGDNARNRLQQWCMNEVVKHTDESVVACENFVADLETRKAALEKANQLLKTENPGPAQVLLKDLCNEGAQRLGRRTEAIREQIAVLKLNSNTFDDPQEFQYDVETMRDQLNAAETTLVEIQDSMYRLFQIEEQKSVLQQA